MELFVDGRDQKELTFLRRGHFAAQVALDELFTLATEGRIHPAEPTAYALDDAATALDDLEQRRVAGKVVLTP